jgi:hypothetical protein
LLLHSSSLAVLFWPIPTLLFVLSPLLPFPLLVQHALLEPRLFLLLPP